jgi:hypothetical protein
VRQLKIAEYEDARYFVLAAIIARGMSVGVDFDSIEATKAVDAGVAAYLTFEGKFNDGQDHDQQT